MRAREFTINIPINIKINGDGEPEIDTASQTDSDPNELDQDPVFVPPLQQQIELTKAGLGKDSKVISRLTADGPQDVKPEPREIGAGKRTGKFNRR
jgi:hypothetical protein